MAASNASKISNKLSKIVSSSVGSPKKPICPKPSPMAQVTSDNVFKKPTGEPKRLISKVAKEVTKTLSAPSPTRRPRSIPLSPWNANHSKLVGNSPRPGAAVGGAKKKIPISKQENIPKSAVKKTADVKKAIQFNTTKKSPSINVAKHVCNNGQKSLKTRNFTDTPFKKPTVSPNVKGKLNTSPSVNFLKPLSEGNPVSPLLEPKEFSFALKDPASPVSVTLAALQDEIDVLSKRLHSIGHATPFYKPPTCGTDVQLNKQVTNIETLRTSKNKGEENNSELEPLDNSVNSKIVCLNESSLTNSFKTRTPNMSDTINLGVSPRIRDNLSPFTSPSVAQLSVACGPSPVDKSPRVRSRRSLESTLSPRGGLPGDKPWSPFGQSLPRVFERQYDNFADAIFAPYITDDENATAMRSPRFSL